MLMRLHAAFLLQHSTKELQQRPYLARKAEMWVVGPFAEKLGRSQN